MKHIREMLKSLKVKRTEDYVIGLNSRTDQYSDNHYLMLDFDSMDTDVETYLGEIGGTILKSGRGFHFIGKSIIVGQKEWAKQLRKIARTKRIKGKIDRDHIYISINRGYSTLRISASPVKPVEPIFYKEA